MEGGRYEKYTDANGTEFVFEIEYDGTCRSLVCGQNRFRGKYFHFEGTTLRSPEGTNGGQNIWP